MLRSCRLSLTWRISCVTLTVIGVVGNVQPLLADPEAPVVESTEGADFVRKRRWPEAVIYLQKIVREDPTELGPVLDLSKALFYSGRREEAVQVLLQAVRYRDERPGKFSAERELLVRRVRVLARQYLTAETLQLVQGGVSQIKSAQFAEARVKLRRALATESNNAEVLLRLGQLGVLEGEIDTAAEYLRTARNLSPYEPVIRLWLARALYLRGENPAAMDEFKLVVPVLAGSEVATMWWAEAWAVSGNLPAALDLLQKEFKNNSNRPYLVATYAKLILEEPAGPRSEREAEGRPERLNDALRETKKALAHIEAGEFRADVMESEQELDLEFRSAESAKTQLESLSAALSRRIKDRVSSRFRWNVQ